MAGVSSSCGSCLTTCALVRTTMLLQPFFSPFWPVTVQSPVFRTAIASPGLTFSCINLLQLSLTSPLGLFLSAKRSLLLRLFRVPSVWNILLRHLTPVSFPLQAEGGTLGLVCFQSLSYCMCVCLGNNPPHSDND